MPFPNNPFAGTVSTKTNHTFFVVSIQRLNGRSQPALALCQRLRGQRVINALRPAIFFESGQYDSREPSSAAGLLRLASNDSRVSGPFIHFSCNQYTPRSQLLQESIKKDVISTAGLGETYQ
jgi:hypothetical protein